MQIEAVGWGHPEAERLRAAQREIAQRDGTPDSGQPGALRSHPREGCLPVAPFGPDVDAAESRCFGRGLA